MFINYVPYPDSVFQLPQEVEHVPFFFVEVGAVVDVAVEIHVAGEVFDEERHFFLQEDIGGAQWAVEDGIFGGKFVKILLFLLLAFF